MVLSLLYQLTTQLVHHWEASSKVPLLFDFVVIAWEVKQMSSLRYDFTCIIGSAFVMYMS